MPLTTFFDINLPYVLRLNADKEWIAFNREYLPLGWNTKKQKMNVSDLPIFTKYKGLTDSKLEKLASSAENITRNSENKIIEIYLYTEKTSPKLHKEYWNAYFEKIKELSQLTINIK